jgi:hypothetical protein
MRVLLVVIDAATPRVVCPAVQTGRLPNLKRIADAGAMHQASATIFPSITPAATTSIITGAYPAEHGIAGAAWFDRASNEVAYYGDDFWVIAKEGFGEFLRDFLVRLNGDRLTAPTLFEMVERTGRSAACLNYLVFRGNVAHKVNVPWLLSLLPGVPLAETVDGPSTLSLGQFVSLRTSPLGRLSSPSGPLHRFGMDDAGTAAALIDLADRNAFADFNVAYFADNDYRSHEVGPHAALPVVERVDRALGEMFDAAGGFERFIRETAVVVTSDHGHCEVLADAGEAVIRLDRILGNFRQADLGRGWQERDDIMICPNMRAAQLYVQHADAVVVDRLTRDVLEDPRVDLVLRHGRLTTTGSDRYVVESRRGRMEFWRGEDGATRVCDAFGTAWSWRGDPATLQLESDGLRIESTEYPNAFERIAGVLDAPDGADLWLTARPGCEFEVPGGKAHVGGASHGGLHALDSLSIVIAGGQGVPKLPRSMRSVDIAPLCMQLLGSSMRYRVGDPRREPVIASSSRHLP